MAGWSKMGSNPEGLPPTPTEFLQLQFLESELSLGETFLVTARIAIDSVHLEHAAQAIQHAHDAVAAIHRFVGQVSSPEQQAQIMERVAQLEDAVARVEAAYKNKQND